MDQGRGNKKGLDWFQALFPDNLILNLFLSFAKLSTY
jgi:hypothetical protein